jgi:hypothetical protein
MSEELIELAAAILGPSLRMSSSSAAQRSMYG